MSPDANTLLLVTIDIEAVLGLLLYYVWAQNIAMRAVAWWGSAHLLRAGSITLFSFYGRWPDAITIDLSNAILLTSFAVTWTGTRIFDHRKAHVPSLLAGAVVWLIAVQVPAIAESIDYRALISAGIVAIYTWLAGAELWRGRDEALISRLPATFLLFAHGALFLLRSPIISFSGPVSGSPFVGSVWMTVLSSEALLFTVSIAFILLAMAKECSELRHKEDATVDPLLELVNRELYHRVGNLLAVAQGIIGLSYRKSLSTVEFRDSIIARLHALHKSVGFINRADWTGVWLRELLQTEFAPVIDRINVSGDDALLRPRAAQNLSLLFYELMTNSSKHGALSKHEGTVTAEWEVKNSQSGQLFCFRWQEHNYENINPPTRQGFGTKLLTRLVPGDMSGQATLNFEPGGLRYELEAPAERVVEQEANVLVKLKAVVPARGIRAHLA